MAGGFRRAYGRFAAKPACAGCREQNSVTDPRCGEEEPAQAGFVADQREALQARRQPPANNTNTPCRYREGVVSPRRGAISAWCTAGPCGRA